MKRLIVFLISVAGFFAQAQYYNYACMGMDYVGNPSESMQRFYITEVPECVGELLGHSVYLSDDGFDVTILAEVNGVKMASKAENTSMVTLMLNDGHESRAVTCWRIDDLEIPVKD